MLKLTIVALFAAVAVAREVLDEEQLLSNTYDGTLDQRGAQEDLVRVRRDFFGGSFGLPNGGRSQQFGYSGSVYTSPVLNPSFTPRHDVSAWGQLSQTSNSRGMTNPITYSGGANWVHNGVRGLSVSASHIPKVGSQASLGGHATLFQNDNHKLTGALQQTRSFDKNFRQVGPESNTGSLMYDHAKGLSVGVSGTRTPGHPDSASVSASVPVATFAGGHGQVSVGAQSTFTEGQKPNHQAGVNIKLTP